MKTYPARFFFVLALALGLAMPAAREANAAATHHAKVVDGVRIYLSVVPGVFFSAFPPGSSEATMHGGVPRGARFKHLMVTLFNASTGKRITNAKVTATVRRVGTSAPGVTKALQPMSWGGYTNYGNYFAMPKGVTYRIDVTVRQPAVRRVIKTAFDYFEYLH